MKKIIIENKSISNFSKPFLIAEIGINHNGSMTLAKEMIVAAKESGADAVKFQFFQKDKLINPYTKKGSSIAKTLSKYTLTKDQVTSLKEYSTKNQISFLATPFDTDAVKFLKSLKQSFYKIASGDINNFMLLESVAKTQKPIILSTGASKLSEIKEAFSFIKKWNSKIILLHCVSLYPTPSDRINLWSIPFLQNTFQIPIGLSDHTKGIKVMLYAALQGASVIEKHFTLDKKLKGPDQKLSATPSDFKRYTKALKQILAITGEYNKKPLPLELDGHFWGRRSLVASKDIHIGDVLSSENIIPLRPMENLPASDYLKMKFKKAKNFIKAGSYISRKDF